MAFILLSIFSCSDDCADSLIDNSVKDVETVLEKAKRKILMMGLDTTGIMDVDGYYVVENDILINKENLFKYPETRQYHTTNTVENGQIITVSIGSDLFVSNWPSVIYKVLNIYNEYTNLKLEFTPYNSNADIIISKDNLFYSNVCAEGEFPTSDGKPGKRIRINSAFYKNIDDYLTENQKIFLIMHEMGHNLGLRHSDCASNGEGAGNVGMIKIPNTPDKDNNSYMKSATCGYSWSSMPEYDAVALKYLFPVIYCIIDFKNCIGVKDIYFKKFTEYKLSRTLIPNKDGYVFVGWHHVENVDSPYYYNTAITDNKTLYAKWDIRHTLETKKCTTYNAEETQVFRLDTTRVVTFTSIVHKALNTWGDLRRANGTYSELKRISGDYAFNWIIDMRGTGEMDVINDPPIAKHSDTFVLEPGTYQIMSSLTTALSQQNRGDGNHGYVETIITYYK